MFIELSAEKRVKLRQERHVIELENMPLLTQLSVFF